MISWCSWFPYLVLRHTVLGPAAPQWRTVSIPSHWWKNSNLRKTLFRLQCSNYQWSWMFLLHYLEVCCWCVWPIWLQMKPGSIPDTSTGRLVLNLDVPDGTWNWNVPQVYHPTSLPAFYGGVGPAVPWLGTVSLPDTLTRLGMGMFQYFSDREMFWEFNTWCSWNWRLCTNLPQKIPLDLCCELFWNIFTRIKCSQFHWFFTGHRHFS